MRIGMVLENNFPPDIRVEKEARSLVGNGYELHLLCTLKLGQKREEIVQGIYVHRFIPQYPNLIYILKKLSGNFTHYKQNWALSLEELVKTHQLDVLHVHDLPLVGTAFNVAKKYNLPVIADLHENYPEAVKVWGGKATALVHKLFQWEKHEQEVLQKCDYVITVAPEGKERLINLGIKPDKITVVSNTEDVGFFKKIKIDQLLVEKYKKNFIVSYVGGFGPHRGLDVAIRSMKALSDKIPNARLILVGGTDPTLRKLAKKLNLEGKVEFIGWRDFDKVATYINLSSVCLVPHIKSQHTDAAVPHKLFQYMLMKKPVVASDCHSLKRIIKETKSGLVFRSGDSTDLARKIFELYKNPDSFGENGYKAVMNKYNWEEEGKKLLKLYKGLESEL